MALEPVDTSRVAVIHNARKSAASVRRFSELLRPRGIEVDVITTASRDEGERAARTALAAGAGLIIAAGGNGTLGSALLPVMEARATLGVLPLGASNDLARELGVRNVDDAARAVLAARARSWDIAACTYRNAQGRDERSLFCSTAGVGFMARALASSQTAFGGAMTNMLGSGVWPTLVTASTRSTRARRCKLQLDDMSVERPLTLLEISKLRSSAGIPLTPDARGDSQMLHAWLVSDAGFWGCAKILYDSLSGSMRHLRHEHVEYFSREPSQNRLQLSRLTRIAVDCDEPMPVHVNGEYVGTTPALFELTKDSFKLLAPPELAGEAVRVTEQRARPMPSSIPSPANPRAARV